MTFPISVKLSLLSESCQQVIFAGSPKIKEPTGGQSALARGLQARAERFSHIQIAGRSKRPCRLGGPGRSGCRIIATVNVPISPTCVVVVGAVTPETMGAYHDAGAKGVGLGSALFLPEYDGGGIAVRAKAFGEAVVLLGMN